MRLVQALNEIEIFREKLLALDETHTDYVAFENKLFKYEVYDFLSTIEVLSCTGVFDSELLSSIEELAKNEHLQKAVNFERLDFSELTMDDTHPDNGDVDELIDCTFKCQYEKIRESASPIIQSLNTKLEQLLFIPDRLL